MKFQKPFLAVAVFSILFVFCKNRSTENTTTTQAEQAVILENDFVDFYKRFHEDSLFQVAHIQWPLAGKEIERGADGALQLAAGLGWRPETWAFQRLPALNTGEFVRDFEPMGSDLMIEKITTTGDVKYMILRRWAKLSGEWRLIFYSAGMMRAAEPDPMR